MHIPKIKIHPESLKHLKRKHPWIVKDKFTERFPRGARFLQGPAIDRTACSFFLHDPKHPWVKARLWSTGNFKQDQFLYQVGARIEDAVIKRKEMFLKRTHFYLAFSEADLLPGLEIIYYNNHILLKMSSFFWEKHLDDIKDMIIESVDYHFGEVKSVLAQFRSKAKKEPPRCLHGEPGEVLVEEFDLKYKLHLGESYDIGIYTDMAGVRSKLLPLFEKSKNVLNLYAYTGAFSLLALKNKAKVTSVDLSKKYLTWLEENIKLNETLNLEDHISIDAPSLDTLKTMAESESKFDLIICDPPSSSTDGKKRTSALKSYEQLIPAMHEVLSEKGQILCFLNTHKVTPKQFHQKMLSIIKYHKLPLSIVKKYGLSEDCLPLANFPEGNYLKGVLLQVK